MSCYHIALNNS